MTRAKIKKTVSFLFGITICIVVVYLFWQPLINIYLPHETTFPISNNSNYSANSGGTYPNGDADIIAYLDSSVTYRFSHPSEKVVILRLDDVQGYAWNNVSMSIIDTVLEKDMSIVLGVIPNASIDSDSKIRTYLINRSKDPRIEIAQHGYNHINDEFSKLNESEADNLIKLGLHKLKSILNVIPVTFVPPHNTFNEIDNATNNALLKNGFKIMSGAYRDNRLYGDVVHVGYSTAIKDYSKNRITPTDEIIDACNNVSKNINICVVLIHPQEYVGDDNKTLDPDKYMEFVKLLDELKRTNVKSVTFKDLMVKT